MNEPLIDIGAVASSILGASAVIVSLIWKYAPTIKSNGNGHTRMLVAHDVDIAHIKEDLAEIKKDMKTLLAARR